MDAFHISGEQGAQRSLSKCVLLWMYKVHASLSGGMACVGFRVLRSPGRWMGTLNRASHRPLSIPSTTFKVIFPTPYACELEWPQLNSASAAQHRPKTGTVFLEPHACELEWSQSG